ncbi:hypothetical protein HK101_000712 [Irineochytrium annulatum]|nr:hypothetical protein HK101_000712 [Irineochytrium annulatum]
MTASLPIIDVSPFVAEMEGRADADTARAKAAVAVEIDKACREYGFFYLKGHGIPMELYESVKTKSRDFFQLPQEEKEKISITKSDLSRGYQRLGQNVTKYQNDWHEAIDLYADVNSDHPIHKIDTKCLKGKNPTIQKPDGMNAELHRYISSCLKVGAATMRAIALGLNLPETFFDKLNDESFWVMRLIGYPPLQRSTDSNVGISCGEHTDYGCLTLLNQDDTTGALQVLTKSGEWMNVDPIKGVFVVNIGDMVNVWTNDLYKATLHRVIHQKEGYRVSVPFFYEPNFTTVVSPLPNCVAESGGIELHKSVMYGTHLLSKVSNNFTESEGK